MTLSINYQHLISNWKFDTLRDLSIIHVCDCYFREKSVLRDLRGRLENQDRKAPKDRLAKVGPTEQDSCVSLNLADCCAYVICRNNHSDS